MNNAETGRLYTLEQIEHEFRRLPEKCLKGPDVITASSVELPAFTPYEKLVPRMKFKDITIPLQLTPESLPGIENISLEEFIVGYPGECDFCLRSRLAQLGLTLSYSGYPLHKILKFEIYHQLKQGKSVIVEAIFNNFSSRPLIIPKNYPLGRFIHNGAPQLSGKALETAFQEKRIQIGNVSFDQLEKVFHRSIHFDIEHEIFGVKIPINPDAWRWTGPHPQNEQIDVSKLPDKDYRAYIKSLQIPIKDQLPTGPTLLIGETLYPVTINDRKITGWIGNWLPGNRKMKTLDDVGWQLFSNAFDGGHTPDGSQRTNWPAIVEHFCGYSKIKNGLLDKDVEFFFYEDQE